MKASSLLLRPLPISPARRCQRSLFLIPLLLILLSSCLPPLHHTAYHDFPHDRWDSRDTLLFPIPPADHDRDVRLTIGLRTTPHFRYQSVTLRAELLDSTAHRPLTVLSLPIPVTDGDTPLGQGNPIAEHPSAPQPLHLKAHRSYTLRLTHRMRLNPLDGIASIGILLE